MFIIAIIRETVPIHYYCTKYTISKMKHSFGFWILKYKSNMSIADMLHSEQLFIVDSFS